MRPLVLTVPNPAEPKRLDRFLVANLHRLSRRQAKGLIGASQVQVDGRTATRGSLELRPGQEVAVQYRPSWRPAPPQLVTEQILKAGENWWAINKPPGLPSHRPAEGLIGAPEALKALLPDGSETPSPAHRLDEETSGVLVLGRGQALSHWSQRFQNREIRKEYRAIVSPAPTEKAGELLSQDQQGREMSLSWQLEHRSTDGSRAQLVIWPKEGRTHQIRIQLAQAGWPIIGDLEYGKPVPGGALRMALHCSSIRTEDQEIHAPLPGGWELLYEKPVEDPPGNASAPSTRTGKSASAPRKDSIQAIPAKLSTSLPHLRISAASARILRAGHPWVLRDKGTGSMASFKAGQIVELRDPKGAFVAQAVLDPNLDLCARVVGLRQDRPPDGPVFMRRANTALAKRKALLSSPKTDAYRLIHGEADLLPGLFVDRWGPLLVATWTSPATEAYAELAYQAIENKLGPLPLYQREHILDLRQKGAHPKNARLKGRWIRQPQDGQKSTYSELEVFEEGLRYEVQPLDGLSTGLYPDQRSNRTHVRNLIQREGLQRVANLFGHTGAFSVAAASAGAIHCATIDLSGTYLRWAERNFATNGIDPISHSFVQQGAREWLETQEAEWDLIILDPPSFASGAKGSRGWNLKRDYGALIGQAACKLQSGGWLLACANHKGLKASWLRQQITTAFRSSGRRTSPLENAPPSPDFPRKKGFPESRSFHGFWVQVQN